MKKIQRVSEIKVGDVLRLIRQDLPDVTHQPFHATIFQKKEAVDGATYYFGKSLDRPFSPLPHITLSDYSLGYYDIFILDEVEVIATLL